MWYFAYNLFTLLCGGLFFQFQGFFVFDNIVDIRRRKTQAATIILSLTILTLFTSTTMFVVVTFIYNETSPLDGFLPVPSGGKLWSFDPPVDFDYPRSIGDLQKDYTSLYQRTGTTALMINVCLPSLCFHLASGFAYHFSSILSNSSS